MKLKRICIAFIALTIMGCSTYGEKLEFNGTEVYYKDGVTEEEANKLGNYLVAEEFADGNRKSVQFAKDVETGNFIFKMVVNPSVVDDEAYQYIFKSFTTQLNEEFDTPVDFYLTNSSFETIKVILAKDVSKAINALKTQVLYTPNVTQSEVQKLADFLVEEKFSDDENAKTVQLDKKDGVYLFRMVVKEGLEKSDSNAMILKLFGVSISQRVFNGDSLRVQMCNNKLETLRDIE